MEGSHQRRQNRCYYVIFIQMIMILAESPPCLCQQISISSPLVDEQSLCPGDRITLTCVTQGSLLIAWRSTDYVSRAIGNQLEFDDFNEQGATQTSSLYNTTVATLTSNRIENGVQVLVSQLHITIRADVNSSSVICVHDNGNIDTITLHLLDDPGTMDIISDQRKNATGGCTVHYSWSPPGNINIRNIKHFMVMFNGTTLEKVNSTGESVYMREHSVCTCAAHDISILAVNRCGRMGNSSDHVISNEPVSQLDTRCDGTDSLFMSMDACPNTAKRLKIALIIVGVSFGVYVIISLIALTCMLVKIISFKIKEREGRKKKGGKVAVSYEMPAADKK